MQRSLLRHMSDLLVIMQDRIGAGKQAFHVVGIAVP
jgi:hypothetical protein